MTYVILYRNLITGRIYPVVSTNAYGLRELREFDTRDDAILYLEKEHLPPDTPAQIVETY